MKPGQRTRKRAHLLRTENPIERFLQCGPSSWFQQQIHTFSDKISFNLLIGLKGVDFLFLDPIDSILHQLNGEFAMIVVRKVQYFTSKVEQEWVFTETLSYGSSPEDRRKGPNSSEEAQGKRTPGSFSRAPESYLSHIGGPHDQ